MAEGTQRLEQKHIQGQVITHTIVKPTNHAPPAEDTPAPQAEEADKESE
ncbi:hypothetical protein ACFW7J_37370 [Streptomyces sp. NPDC059525]